MLYTRLSVLSPVFLNLSRKFHRMPTCVVIGGGASGLSAASALRKAGMQVTVVEANSRIGETHLASEVVVTLRCRLVSVNAVDR